MVKIVGDKLKEIFDEIFVDTPNLLDDIFSSIEIVGESKPKVARYQQYSLERHVINEPHITYPAENVRVGFEEFINTIFNKYVEQIKQYEEEDDDDSERDSEYYTRCIKLLKIILNRQYGLQEDLYVRISYNWLKKERPYVKFVCKQPITVGLTVYATVLAYWLYYGANGDKIWETGVGCEFSGLSITKSDETKIVCDYWMDS